MSSCDTLMIWFGEKGSPAYYKGSFSGLERHFGARLAFQSCHRVAAFRSSGVDGERYRRFVSPRRQLLSQSPEVRNC